MAFFPPLLLAADTEDWAARTAERLATVPDDAARVAFVRQLIDEDGTEGGGGHVAALVGAARVLDRLPADRRGPEVLRGYAEAALRGDAFDRDYLRVAAARGLLDEAGRPSLPEPDRVEAAQAAELAVVPATWVVCVVPPEVVRDDPDGVVAARRSSWKAVGTVDFEPAYRRHRPVLTRAEQQQRRPSSRFAPENGLTVKSHSGLRESDLCGDGLEPGYLEHSWSIVRGGGPAQLDLADALFPGCRTHQRVMGVYRAVLADSSPIPVPIEARPIGVSGSPITSANVYIPHWVWGYDPSFVVEPRLEDCADAADTTAAVAAWNGNVRRAFGLPGSTAPDPAPGP